MSKILTYLLLFCSLSQSWGSEKPKFDRSVKFADNFEAAIPTPSQDENVQKKLSKLRKKSGKRPNILWLIVDDMGYGDPGCYGGGAVVGASTPNIDKLAMGGLKLTSCYSQHTCTPTRSAILTGRLPIRTGLIRPILAGDKITTNPWADEISLPKLLSDADYYTLLSGKWHIGESKGMRPHDVGFDEYYGYYPAQKEISQRFDHRRFPNLVLNPERLAAFEAVGPTDFLTHGFKGGETNELQQIKSIKDMSEADQVLTDFTVKRIQELAANDKPFFIEHCFMKVHCDNFPHPDYTGKSESKYAYKDSVHEVDTQVGQIIQALEKAKVLENTLVFFTSDNGPQMDAWPDAGHTPFRGAKGTTWEGGVRVPGIAYWKGMIAPNQTSDELFDLIDLFGIGLNLAGISADKLPKDKYYDYIDQTSFLLTTNGQSKRETVYFWWGKELMACRMKEYKAHTKVIIPHAPHMHIDLATVQDVGLAPWFFNLYLDPKEQMTVGHRRDPWMATVAGKLKEHAASFKKFPPKNVGL
jgi:arylsulfatase